MYARTIVLELVRREDEARRERDATLYEHDAKGADGANGVGGTKGGDGANGTSGAGGAGGIKGSDGAKGGDAAKAADAALGREHGNSSDALDARIMSETLRCEGVTFDWWVIGEQPAFVTISSPKLGKLNGFTDSDPEVFAMCLARQLLGRRGGSGAETEDAEGSSQAFQCPLTKPGWFEK